VIDVDSVLNYVIAHYPVDLHRIYLTGFSMGGGSCWDYAGSLPAFANRIAALLPVSGSGTPDTVKTRIMAAANLPVWATHNDSDKTVPVTTTLTYIGYINRIPAPKPAAKKTIFRSTSHNAWAATYKPTFRENGMNVFEWMLQYQRTPALPQATKQVKVNLYGGIYPYNNVSWNNWNVKSTLSSGALRYWDATGSSIAVSLSQSNGVSDNGTTYGSGMAPAEVLRYITSGSAERFLTLKGLSPSYSYSLELYASRGISGNSTIFKTGSATQTIATYKNLTNKAVFTNLVPNTSGQIIVSIDKTASYNYLNGFMLTEYGKVPANKAPVANAGTDKIITLPTNSVKLSGSGSDGDGKIRCYTWDKVAGPSQYIINNPGSAATTVSGLTAGVYTFRLTVMDNGAARDVDDVQVTVNQALTTTSNYRKVNLYGGTKLYTNTAWKN
jgi:dienelactone hydrolase